MRLFDKTSANSPERYSKIANNDTKANILLDCLTQNYNEYKSRK